MKKIGSTWNLWDLHIHTNASDGKGTCQEILDVVKSKGISCIAVTDHHTIDNIEKMKTLAKPMNITVISGIEFRTEYGQASVHMIGLFPDEHNGIKLSPEFLKENVLNQLASAPRWGKIQRESLRSGLGRQSLLYAGLLG